MNTGARRQQRRGQRSRYDDEEEKTEEPAIRFGNFGLRNSEQEAHYNRGLIGGAEGGEGDSRVNDIDWEGDGKARDGGSALSNDDEIT